MVHRNWIACAALLAGLGVVAGAFGAHALEARLSASGHLATWETAVRYQLVHALALILYVLWRERSAGGTGVAWCFFLGTLAFSGSLYALSFGFLPHVMGPLTPLGGALWIVAWGAFAWQALRARPTT